MPCPFALAQQIAVDTIVRTVWAPLGSTRMTISGVAGVEEGQHVTQAFSYTTFAIGALSVHVRL